MTAGTVDLDASGERLDRFPSDVKPVSAAIAVLKFLKDKEDTSQVFKVLDYLDGPQEERNYQRFASSETGKRLIRENADLAPVLCDRDWLKSLPPGSLGAAYLYFIESENISAAGLIEAEKQANARSLYLEPARRMVISTGYQLHDMWHVVVGYGRNLVGEMAVLAFTYGQLDLKGIYIFALIMGLKERVINLNVPVFKILDEGRRLGRQAEWLLDQDWKALLAMPLEDVRKQLNVGAPETYLKYADYLQKDDIRRRAKMGYVAAY